MRRPALAGSVVAMASAASALRVGSESVAAMTMRGTSLFMAPADSSGRATAHSRAGSDRDGTGPRGQAALEASQSVRDVYRKLVSALHPDREADGAERERKTALMQRANQAYERNDLLELLDDRVGTRATLITSQLPVSAWHEWLNDPTLADAILDRIVHAAHKIALKGESMRRKQVMP